MHLSKNMALENALLGGLIVGTSSAAFMFLSGRITGLSGITRGVARSDGEDWQYTYTFGLFASGVLVKQLYPHLVVMQSSTVPQSIPVMIAAGLLVGYGTRLGSGCTSGHGLCGLSRFSPRSLAAVMTFMATGAITATIANQPEIVPLLTTSTPYQADSFLTLMAPTAAIIGLSYAYSRNSNSKLLKPMVRSSMMSHVSALACSLLFGTGLIIGQMVDTSRVLGFLDFLNPVNGWDPSLAGVMGGGVFVTALAFPFMKNTNLCTLICNRPMKNLISIGTEGMNTKIDAPLLVGSALFGMGWGLLGICPGPGIVSLGLGSAAASIFVPSMLLGMMIQTDYLW